MTTPMLRAVGLTRTFTSTGATVVALNDVSLTVDAGEVVAVEGPSGSGKSTLLHLLAGLDRPDAGTVKVGRTDPADMSETERTTFRRRNIGIVLQRPDLLPTLDALDNVAVPAILDGCKPRVARQRAAAQLDAVGLTSRRRHRPGELSGGEQQRLCLARALVNQPDIVLADEPTATLDSNGTDDLLDLLRAVTVDGRAVVLATHDPRAAARAHRSIRLVDGAIVWPERDLRIAE